MRAEVSWKFNDYPKPTRGNCYRNAFQFVSANPKWKLVHGVCIGTGAKNLGKEFGHAWAELSRRMKVTLGGKSFSVKFSFCFDPLTKEPVVSEIFYHAGMVKKVFKYTRRQAFKEALRTGNYGPWEEEICMALHEGKVKFVPKKRSKR